MSHGISSPGVGLAAPNDPRLVSRLAQPNRVTYINNRPPQFGISRLVPSTTTASATITTFTSTTATKSFSQIAASTNTMKKGSQLKIKSRPKKNLSFNSDSESSLSQPVGTNGSNSSSNNEQQQQQQQQQQQSQQKQVNEPKTIPKIINLDTESTQRQNNPLTTSTAEPVIGVQSSNSQPSKVSPAIQRVDSASKVTERKVDEQSSPTPPFANVIRHLPAFRSSLTSKPLILRKPAPVIVLDCDTEPAAEVTATETAPSKPSAPTTPNPTVTTSSSSTQTNTMKQQAVIKPTNTNGNSTPAKNLYSGVGIPTLQATPNKSPASSNQSQQQTLPSAFSWDIYLEKRPGEIAPKEAFKQDLGKLTNLFKLGMKLEAKDPRNSSTWCLATVQMIEGLRLRLRFDGSDSMNDFFELINSENIRPVNSKPDEPMMPPMAYKGNLSSYPKFVEKILMKPDTKVAPPNCFVPPPTTPERNLFKPEMRLEAIDKKNPYLICPATVGEVNGDNVKIIFDGWKGSFDYTCKYYSRDIFPVNWCRDNNHYIAAPNGWEALIGNSPPKAGKQTSKLSTPSPKTPTRLVAPSSIPSKEAHLSKLQLQPRNSPATSSPKTPQAQSSPNLSKAKQTTPKVREAKRKYSASPEFFPTSDTQSQIHVESENPNEESSGEGTGETNGLQFQCQRTVPYDEWVKINKLNKFSSTSGSESSTAGSISTSQEDKSTSTSTQKPNPKEQLPPVDKPVAKPVDNSDTDPVVSTVIDPPESESSRPKRGNPAKKTKLSHEIDLEQNLILPSSAYTSWSMEEVLDVIKSNTSFAKYLPIFEDHEINGIAFGMLTADMMIRHMGLKMGPALTIADLVEKVKRLR